MTNPFLKKNADNLLVGIAEGDKITVTWFLESAGLGGSQEMGPITFKVLAIDERWVGLRDTQHGAYIRLPRTAIRSVRPAD